MSDGVGIRIGIGIGLRDWDGVGWNLEISGEECRRGFYDTSTLVFGVELL